MPRKLEIAALFLGALLAVCCLQAVSAAADAVGAKASRQLEQRMNEIIALQQKINRKTAQAQAIGRRLKDQFALVRAEIRDECRQHGVGSYEQALRWQKLANHLSLAQQLFSYIKALDRKVHVFRNDYRRLGFFYQEAVDDLKIIHTLPSLNISAFMADTGRAIERSRRHLDRYLVDSRDVMYDHTPRIWEVVTGAKTPGGSG